MQLSVVDIYRNMTEQRSEMKLSYGAYALFFAYVEYWNNHGRFTNQISPRNSALCNYLGMSKPTFYKYRKELEDKGYIIVDSQTFQPDKDGRKSHSQGQGLQKPAVISLADWLIKSTDHEMTDLQDLSNIKESTFEVNNRIQELRKRDGLTQQQLANYLNKKGVSATRVTIARYEAGTRKPSDSVWNILSQYFHVPQSYIKNSGIQGENLNLDMNSCKSLIEYIYNKSKHNNPIATFCYQSICSFLLKYRSFL